jgi:hypothetical protein
MVPAYQSQLSHGTDCWSYEGCEGEHSSLDAVERLVFCILPFYSTVNRLVTTRVPVVQLWISNPLYPCTAVHKHVTGKHERKQ